METRGGEMPEVDPTLEDVQNLLKNFLFEHPKFLDKKIDLEDLIYVGLFPLRDRYLWEHEELRK
jgi:hypothetical protein